MFLHLAILNTIARYDYVCGVSLFRFLEYREEVGLSNTGIWTVRLLETVPCSATQLHTPSWSTWRLSLLEAAEEI